MEVKIFDPSLLKSQNKLRANYLLNSSIHNELVYLTLSHQLQPTIEEKLMFEIAYYMPVECNDILYVCDFAINVCIN